MERHSNNQQSTFHLAQKNDSAEISQLLQQNSALLQGIFSQERVCELLSNSATWVLLVRQKSRLQGVLFTQEDAANTPDIITAMLSAWPAGRHCWIYGPICIATQSRGKGLSEALFARACRHYGSRKPVLFVRHDNIASLKAHIRLGLQPVAQFSYDNQQFIVLSQVDKASATMKIT